MATKITKTMRELLVSGTTDINQICVDSGYYAGARSGSFGRRKDAAADKLLDMGLITFVKSHHGVHQMTGNWTSCHYFERIYRLTDEGRKVAATLKDN